MNAIIRSKSFEKKRLGTHIVNPAIGCTQGCLYCYVPSCYRWQLNGGKDMIVHDSDDWFLRLRHQLWSIKERGTAIVSTATEPFSEELYDISMKAVNLLLAHNWTVRVITKKPFEFYHREKLWENGIHAKHRDKVIFNISIGDFRYDWWNKVEPNADPPLQRVSVLRSLQELGYRTAVMACPIAPGQYRETFEAYGDCLKLADEVFCEIINPRGPAYQKIARYFPEVEILKTKQGRSAEALRLIETAHRFVPSMEKLRVLTYSNIMTPPDQARARYYNDYKGVVWL